MRSLSIMLIGSPAESQLPKDDDMRALVHASSGTCVSTSSSLLASSKVGQQMKLTGTRRYTSEADEVPETRSANCCREQSQQHRFTDSINNQLICAGEEHFSVQVSTGRRRPRIVEKWKR
jgi:hypothetical protein